MFSAYHSYEDWTWPASIQLSRVKFCLSLLNLFTRILSDRHKQNVSPFIISVLPFAARFQSVSLLFPCQWNTIIESVGIQTKFDDRRYAPKLCTVNLHSERLQWIENFLSRHEQPNIMSSFFSIVNYSTSSTGSIATILQFFTAPIPPSLKHCSTSSLEILRNKLGSLLMGINRMPAITLIRMTIFV